MAICFSSETRVAGRNANIVRQVCDALGHAHTNGIIHTRPEAENVIVT
jgi:tRNA A-37 threonylcarbamoyl transferase component Bud32